MIKNFNIELLRTFILVSKNKSFTETAKQLHKTQSTISLQIKRLEESMSCKLFERDTKLVKLTSDGQFFLGSANRIVNLNDELLVGYEKIETNETIKIGFPDDYATLFLPEIMSLYSEHFPDKKIEVICDTSKSLFTSLKQGDLDIAICIDIDIDRAFENEIRKEKLYWVGGKDYTPDYNLSISLALFPEDCIIRKTAIDRIEGSELIWHLGFSGKNIATIHSLIAKGNSISVLSESMMPSDCKIFDESHGFPILPTLVLSINKREGQVPEHVGQLYEYMKAVVGDSNISTISRFST